MSAGTGLEAPAWDVAGAVPVVWQPSPGPVIAALGFRVGRADEPLARSGLTHLVEHLALSGLGDRLYEYDGFVNGSVTWFGFRGAPDEAVDYFAHVAGALSRLPIERMDAEIGVLRAEASRRSMTTAGRCLLLRYGAQGWGTYDLPEYGVGAVSPEGVKAWASEWFVAGNAVLWTTGPPTPPLAVDLPGGPCRPEPRAVRRPGLRLPAWTTHPGRVTAMSTLMPRTADGADAAGILQSRLRHVLRDLDGTSYEVALAVDHLDAHTTHILVTADGPPASVVEALNAVTGALACDGPTGPELVHQQALRRRRAADPTLAPARLAAAAEARLCRWSAPEPAGEGGAVAGPDGRGTDSMAGLFAEALATALYLVPVGTPVPASLAEPLDTAPGRPVAGRAHRPAGGEGGAPEGLVIGAEGVSQLGGDRPVTVRIAEAAAVLAWRNGVRLLVGLDGTVVAVDPACWHGAEAAIAELDGAVPASLLVPMGDRPSWSVGRPRRARRGGSS